jgi:hypothetical protein
MDDLTRPLGQTTARKPASRAPRLLVPLIAGILFLPVAIFAGWAMFVGDRLGGEPVALSEITADTTTAGASAQTPVIKVVSPLASSAAEQPALRPNGQTVTIIDGSSGRREDVLVPNSATVPLAGQPRKANLAQTGWSSNVVPAKLPAGKARVGARAGTYLGPARQLRDDRESVGQHEGNGL